VVGSRAVGFDTESCAQDLFRTIRTNPIDRKMKFEILLLTMLYRYDILMGSGAKRKLRQLQRILLRRPFFLSPLVGRGRPCGRIRVAG
jgi:hypothetical protein